MAARALGSCCRFLGPCWNIAPNHRDHRKADSAREPLGASYAPLAALRRLEDGGGLGVAEEARAAVTVTVRVVECPSEQTQRVRVESSRAKVDARQLRSGTKGCVQALCRSCTYLPLNAMLLAAAVVHLESATNQVNYI